MELWRGRLSDVGVVLYYREGLSDGDRWSMLLYNSRERRFSDGCIGEYKYCG